METASIWTGGSKDSWFNQNKLIKCRSLLHCERGYNLTQKMVENGDFYLIAIDVARYGGNDTSIMVIKVHKNNSNWKKSVVYTENINKSHFTKQAVRIKELYSLYWPKEIVIDGNGIGGGLIDALMLPTTGPDGSIQEPLYVMNDKENYPIPRGEEKRAVIFDIKANSGMNSELYSNLFIQINSGYVALLANERIVKEKLLATKKGQRMNYLSREKFLLPYIMTSRLIDEINNLKLKPTGVAGQIAVEQITRRINKDRVSALAYGLFRIKYYEDKEKRKKRSGFANASKMVFFSNKRRRRD